MTLLTWTSKEKYSKNFLSAISAFFLALALSGCSSFGKQLKSFLSGDKSPKETSANTATGLDVRFSEQPEIEFDDKKKQYRHMSKKDFEETAQMQDSAGSLWVPEGQGSYLFAQNMVRLVGDMINVKIDGEPKKQLETKATVIKEVLQKARRQARKVASEGQAQAQANNKGAEKESDSKEQEKSEVKKDDPKMAALGGASNKDEEEKDESGFDVNLIPTRIVERLSDGSYRVRGNQNFMIGKNEYRVIVTGIVQSKDVGDDGVDSSKLIDSKFDIVSLKKDLKL